MKKFWKYFLIVILALMGLCCIGVLYIFFVPNSSLFGICYISYKDNKTSNSYSVKTNSIQTIDVDSRDYDFEVVQGAKGNNDIYLKVFANSFGFVLKKHSTIDIKSNLTAGCLTFDVDEPYGLCSAKNSKITLVIPEDFSVNLILTNHNASTTINSEKLIINNLTYNTNNGECFITSGKISGKISVTTNRGNINLSNSIILNNNDLDFSSNSGNLYASNSNLGVVEIKKNNYANIKIKSCSSFTFRNTTAGGTIQIEEVGDIIVASSSTNVNLGTIKSGASISLTSSGYINVKNIEANSTLSTHNGNIVVENASSPISLSSNGYGDIQLKNTTASLFAETSYGDITVEYDSNADSYKNNSSARLLQAKTYAGTITATGVDHTTITITGDGNANIYAHDITLENEINLTTGSVYVEFPTEASFRLTTNSETGVSNVNYLTLSDIGNQNHNYYGENTFNINSGSSNLLKISSTSGYIKVRDVAMKNY